MLENPMVSGYGFPKEKETHEYTVMITGCVVVTASSPDEALDLVDCGNMEIDDEMIVDCD